MRAEFGSFCITKRIFSLCFNISRFGPRRPADGTKPLSGFGGPITLFVFLEILKRARDFCSLVPLHPFFSNWKLSEKCPKQTKERGVKNISGWRDFDPELVRSDWFASRFASGPAAPVFFAQPNVCIERTGAIFTPRESTERCFYHPYRGKYVENQMRRKKSQMTKVSSSWVMICDIWIHSFSFLMEEVELKRSSMSCLHVCKEIHIKLTNQTSHLNGRRLMDWTCFNPLYTKYWKEREKVQPKLLQPPITKNNTFNYCSLYNAIVIHRFLQGDSLLIVLDVVVGGGGAIDSCDAGDGFPISIGRSGACVRVVTQLYILYSEYFYRRKASKLVSPSQQQ